MKKGKTGNTRKNSEPAAARASVKARRLAEAGALMREVDIEETAAGEAAHADKVRPKKPKAATREGKTGVVLYVWPEVAAALRRLAALHDTDVQTLGRQALVLLFAEYGETLPDGGSKPSSQL